MMYFGQHFHMPIKLQILHSFLKYIHLYLLILFLFIFRPEINQSIRMSDISRNDIEEDGGEPDERVPCIGKSTYNDYGKCY